MKKIILLLLAFLTLISMTGCSSEPAPATFSEDEIFAKQEDYLNKSKKIIKSYKMKATDPVIDITTNIDGTIVSRTYQNDSCEITVAFIYESDNNGNLLNPKYYINIFTFADTEKEAIENLNDKTKTKVFSDIITSAAGDETLAEKTLSDVNTNFDDFVDKFSDTDKNDDYSMTRKVSDDLTIFKGHTSKRKQYTAGFTFTKKADMSN